MWTLSQAYGLHHATDSHKIFRIEPYCTQNSLDRLRDGSVGNQSSLRGIIMYEAVEAIGATFHGQIGVAPRSSNYVISDT